MSLYPLRLSILAALMIVLVLSLSGAPGVAHAGGTVTNCVWSGAGGLQEALAGGGTVTFACDGVIVVPGIGISYDTTLDAAGHDVTLSGNQVNGVFSVNSAQRSLTLIGLKVADGNTSGSGAAIYNRGTLTVTNSTLSGNRASARGGGIYNNYGTVTVTNSVFLANHAISGGGIDNERGTVTVTNSTFFANHGGGIFMYFGTLTVTGSTLAGNSADSGGGIFITGTGGPVTISNSTFSGNSATHEGGSIRNGNNAMPLTVTNSTFSGNSATSGGGIDTDSSVTVTNSIIAGGPAGANCTAPVTDGGNNISDDTSCGFGAGDGVDPLLKPLADNGGPTLTHGLKIGSPASGAGNPAVCAAAPVNNLDQRGEPRPRPVDTTCDSGAFESPLPFYASLTLLTPTHKSTVRDQRPTLTWTEVGDDLNYRVQIARDPAFVAQIQVATVSDPVYTAAPLADGQVYYWRVQIVVSEQDQGPWSAVRSFRIDTSAPPRPPRLTPPSGATIRDPTPTFRWGRDGESAGYVFQLAADESFEIVLIEETLARPHYDVIAPLLPGVYWWRVAAVDTAGNVSEWSAASFTLVPDTVIITPPPTDLPPTDLPPTTAPTVAPPVLSTPVPPQPPPPHKPVAPTPTPAPPGDGKVPPPRS